MKITIQTDADFTPKGKRTAKMPMLNYGGFGPTRMIRWYVSGRIYHTLRLTVENIEMTEKWLAA